jgi:hypothetical protein
LLSDFKDATLISDATKIKVKKVKGDQYAGKEGVWDDKTKTWSNAIMEILHKSHIILSLIFIN